MKSVFSKFTKIFIVCFFILSVTGAVMWPLKQQLPFPTIDDSFNSIRVLPSLSPFSTAVRAPQTLAAGVDFPERLAKLQTIGFLVESQGNTTVKLSNEEIANLGVQWLSANGKNCLIPAASHRKIHAWHPVWFTIATECHGDDFKLGRLSVSLKSDAKLQISAWKSGTRENPGFYVNLPDGQKSYLAGYFSLEAQDLGYKPRLAWILHMWQWNPIMGSLWILILVFGFGLAAILVLNVFKTSRWIGPTIALGAFCLSGLYATISPPFQAPDEADHFVTFLDTIQRPDLNDKALEFANRAHYSRLMCHMIEKLTSECLASPMEAGWPEGVSATAGLARSPWAHYVWKALGTVLPKQWGVGSVHYALRIFNALYCALFIGLAVALRLRTSVNHGTEAMQKVFVSSVVGIFLLPTIWHFSNHNSNHAFILAHYFVLTIFALPLIVANKMKALDWTFLMLSSCIAVFAGRAAFVSLFLLAGMLCIRCVVLGASAKGLSATRRELLPSVMVCVVPLCLMFVFKSSPYTQHLVAQLHWDSFGAFAALLVGFPILFLLSSIMGSMASRLSTRYVNAPKIAFVTLMAMAILLIAGITGAPLYTAPLGLQNLEHSMPDLAGRFAYGLDVISKFYANSHPDRDDFLLIRSFWAGFGCPEVILPKRPVQILQCLVWLGWAGGWLIMARKSLTVAAFGSVALLLLSFVWLGTLSFFSLPSTMHGRYMAGFYMLWVGGGIWGWSYVLSRYQSQYSNLIALCVCGLHAVTIIALGYRYFG